MLSDFVTTHRATIIEVAKERLLSALPVVPTESGVANAVPFFLDALVAALPPPTGMPAGKATAAKQFGHDLHRLGFTLSQVVHGYGAVCQIVTGLADEQHVPDTAHEFHILNRLLDEAIADAVTQFDERRMQEAKSQEAVQLGFLAHELRNTLAGAIMSAAIIRSGKAGVAGKTADVLDRALARMRDLIDRSIAEVRLNAETGPLNAPVRMLDLFDEIETTAAPDAEKRNVRMTLRIHGGDIEITTDRQLLISAISNLLQNAIKYTQAGSAIEVRARLDGGNVVIEVEDVCGGLPSGRAETIFGAFVQANADRTGLGLGLTIARRLAVRLGGQLSVRDLPGKGCVFTLTLPANVPRQAAARNQPGSAAPHLH